jgi:pimeloyl-ACP methyl ester carboxylesterase
MAPLTEEKVSTSIGKQSVWRAGPPDGPTLVYLHSATGEVPLAPVLEDLAETYQVVAPLFPGFGESEGIDQINDIEDAVFHLLDLWDALGLSERGAAVVGASLGGWMAAELAARYPERVGSLVLISPAGVHVEGTRVGEIFGRRPGDLAEDLFFDQTHPMAAMMRSLDALADNKAAEIPFELLRPTLQSLQATAKLAWNPYLHNPKLPRWLGRVTAPTLVVHAVQDRLVPRAHKELYASRIPAARLVEIEGAGHLVHLEKPYVTANEIRRHLDRI